MDCETAAVSPPWAPDEEPQVDPSVGTTTIAPRRAPPKRPIGSGALPSQSQLSTAEPPGEKGPKPLARSRLSTKFWQLVPKALYTRNVNVRLSPSCAPRSVLSTSGVLGSRGCRTLCKRCPAAPRGWRTRLLATAARLPAILPTGRSALMTSALEERFPTRLR